MIGIVRGVFEGSSVGEVRGNVTMWAGLRKGIKLRAREEFVVQEVTHVMGSFEGQEG